MGRLPVLLSKGKVVIGFYLPLRKIWTMAWPGRSSVELMQVRLIGYFKRYCENLKHMQVLLVSMVW